MKAKSARSVKPKKKVTSPNDSVIIQIGVAFVVVAGFALLAYSMKYFLP
jgi:hypothetical protein